MKTGRKKGMLKTPPIVTEIVINFQRYFVVFGRGISFKIVLRGFYLNERAVFVN